MPRRHSTWRPSLVSLLTWRNWSWSARRRLARLARALQGRPTAVLLVNHPLPSYDDRRPPDDRLESVGGPGVSQHAAVRVALHSAQLCLADCWTIGHLHVWATVLKHHGLPRSPALPLAITPCGLHRAYELVELSRLAGCLGQTPLGLTFGEHVLGRSVARPAPCDEC